MKYAFIIIFLVIGMARSYAQEKIVQASNCVFNPQIVFGKQRMKLNEKEIKTIREFGYSIIKYSDSTKRNFRIILRVFGNENSVRGILRAKMISDLLVKYEAIERRLILIYELPLKDDIGDERIDFELEDEQ